MELMIQIIILKMAFAIYGHQPSVFHPGCNSMAIADQLAFLFTLSSFLLVLKGFDNALKQLSVVI